MYFGLHLSGALVLAALPICGAIRLARFNTQSGQRAFTGLPIPAAGGFLAALVFSSRQLDFELFSLMIVLLAYLMVSNIVYPKYRWRNVSRKTSIKFYILAVSTLPALFDIRLVYLPFAVYVLLGII